MATHLSMQNFRPVLEICVSSRRQYPTQPIGISLSTFKRTGISLSRLGPCLAAQSPLKSTVEANELVEFLYKVLPHFFDDQGIDRTMYDDRVRFRDPITKHDTISGYLFNIQLLKQLFKPDFQLHWVKQTGPYEIATGWTMVMRFILVPWKPELVFTGTSIMGINPKTQKFCSHVLRIYKTPDLETTKYQILKRRADYEVRNYSPFVVVETKGDKLSGSAGFNDVAGYIFGKNSTMEKIPMTTTVFTQAFDAELLKVCIQIVLLSGKDLSSLPDPNQKTIGLRKVEEGIAAVLKFSGKPTEDIVYEKEKALRSALIRDGLKPKDGCLLAQYNDPGRTWSFIVRNEVLIWLEEFEL